MLIVAIDDGAVGVVGVGDIVFVFVTSGIEGVVAAVVAVVIAAIEAEAVGIVGRATGGAGASGVDYERIHTCEALEKGKQNECKDEILGEHWTRQDLRSSDMVEREIE